MSVEDFIENYLDSKFLEYCKDCRNYDNIWTCPPRDIDPEEFFRKYNTIEITVQNITPSREEIEISKEKGSAKAFNEMITPLKDKYLIERLGKEKDGEYLIFPGSCSLCKCCTRPEGLDCRKPDLMRFSLDSFGVNITKMLEEEFGQKLYWSKDGLPEQVNLTYGLLK